MSDAPLPNSPEARTPTGELKDQTTTDQNPPENTDTQTKTPTETKDEGNKEPPKVEPGKAPEKYEFKAPEGFEFDEKFLGKASEAFKGMNLTQEQAQSLIDLHAEALQAAGDAPQEAYQKMREDWRKASEEHPELKGKLGEGKEVSVEISRALDAIGDPGLVKEFKEISNLTGFGDHPAVIRVIAKLAKVFNEGKPVSSGGPSAPANNQRAKPTAAQALYPNLKSSNA